MIVINTTYHIYTAIEPNFIKWLETALLPALRADARWDSITVDKILLKVDSELEGYAVRAITSSMDCHHALEAWNEGEASQLTAAAMAQFPEQILPFTTPMETLDL